MEKINFFDAYGKLIGSASENDRYKNTTGGPTELSDIILLIIIIAISSTIMGVIPLIFLESIKSGYDSNEFSAKFVIVSSVVAAIIGIITNAIIYKKKGYTLSEFNYPFITFAFFMLSFVILAVIMAFTESSGLISIILNSLAIFVAGFLISIGLTFYITLFEVTIIASIKLIRVIIALFLNEKEILEFKMNLNKTAIYNELKEYIANNNINIKSIYVGSDSVLFVLADETEKEYNFMQKGYTSLSKRKCNILVKRLMIGHKQFKISFSKKEKGYIASNKKIKLKNKPSEEFVKETKKLNDWK